MCKIFFKKTNKPDISPSVIYSSIAVPSPTPSKILNNMWSSLSPIDLNKIRQVEFPENKYFQDEHTKTQIVLHHTISGPNIDGDVSTWINGKYNVGVAIIIDREGIPHQLFSSKHWAYHLGAGDHLLDKHSIAIEIDSWGGLVLGDNTTKQFGKNEDGTPRMIYTMEGKYYAYYGNPVNLSSNQIQYYSNEYRGYNYFEKYTNEQIKTVGELLLFWRNRYNIPLYYNPSMFNFSQEALNGKPGLWSHTSYRKDKSDIHPQPEMMEMIRAICTDDIPLSYIPQRKWFRFDRKKGRDAENTTNFIW